MTPTPGTLRYHATEARRDAEYWAHQARHHDERSAYCRKEAIRRMTQADEYEELASRGEITVEYREAAE